MKEGKKMSTAKEKAVSSELLDLKTISEKLETLPHDITSQCICPIETMSRACYTINSRRGVTCPILTRRDL